jgi:hypothetical protein
MSTTATIHEKLYVTLKYLGNNVSNEDGLLGFASPYTKDEAFKNRKHTQDKWAYGYGITVNINDEDDCTVTGEGKIGSYGKSTTWDASMLFMTNCYPRVISNELIAGFEIAKSVRRSGWNGGGNVKWRISDPRGFDLEISSENFARIITCCTLEKGVIQGRCTWGRVGKDNILLPEASDIYQEAALLTSKINNKISLKDINLGDTVELHNNKIHKDNLLCQYLGKYHFLSANSIGNIRSDSLLYTFNEVVEFNHLFKSIKTNNYFVVTTPKIIYVHNKIEIPLNKEEVANIVNKDLDRNNNIIGISKAILISESKIDLTTITTTLEPINEKLHLWPIIDKYNVDPIICKFEGNLYLASRSSEKYNGQTCDYTQELTNITLNTNNNSLVIKSNAELRQGKPTGYYNAICRSDFNFYDLEMFRMVVTAGDVTGKVYRL